MSQTTMYDGKLTAWLDIEIDKILDPIVPTEDKLYEGKISFGLKRRSKAHQEARRQLRSLAREYAARERSSDYESPVQVDGDVYHGEES